MVRNIKHWQDFFKDKHGKVVLIEAPNPPLIGWALFLGLGHLLHSTGCLWLSTALLFAWAFMEITQGTTYFRQLLGAVILVMLIVKHF